MFSNLILRTFEDTDIELLKHWLYQPHVARWFDDPDSWIAEISGRYRWLAFREQ